MIPIPRVLSFLLPVSWALHLGACAQKPRPVATFALVEGARIGKLEIHPVEYGEPEADAGGDPAMQGPRYYAITFDYPGSGISVMKVFRDGKVVKTCDEAGYAKLRPWRPTVGHGPHTIKVKPRVDPMSGRETNPMTREEDLRKRPKLNDIECHLEIGDLREADIEISLYEYDTPVARYRLVAP